MEVGYPWRRTNFSPTTVPVKGCMRLRKWAYLMSLSNTTKMTLTPSDLESHKIMTIQRRQRNSLTKSKIQSGIIVCLACIALSHMSLHIFFHCWSTEYLLNLLNGHDSWKAQSDPPWNRHDTLEVFVRYVEMYLAAPKDLCKITSQLP